MKRWVRLPFGPRARPSGRRPGHPGSPTFPSNYDRQRGTVGLLTIEDGVPRAELIPLSEGARRFLPK